MSTEETCRERSKFGEWICDAPAGHAEGQHYFIKATS